MQQVIFHLLGPPEIYCNDQLIKIPRRRSRALLYYQEVMLGKQDAQTALNNAATQVNSSLQGG